MFTSRELSVLCLLFSIAFASLSIMMIGFANGSRMPLAIYGLATTNGVVTPETDRLIAMLGTRKSKQTSAG
jgi:hypothetical protein